MVQIADKTVDKGIKRKSWFMLPDYYNDEPKYQIYTNWTIGPLNLQKHEVDEYILSTGYLNVKNSKPIISPREVIWTFIFTLKKKFKDG